MSRYEADLMNQHRDDGLDEGAQFSLFGLQPASLSDCFFFGLLPSAKGRANIVHERLQTPSAFVHSVIGQGVAHNILGRWPLFA